MKMLCERWKPKTEFRAPDRTDRPMRRFWLYVASRQRLQIRFVGMFPLAQVMYQPPPAPPARPAACGRVSGREVAEDDVPAREGLDDVLVDAGAPVLSAALDVAGDDEVARVHADPDRVEGGTEAAAVAVDVEDEVDRAPIAVAVAADQSDGVAVAGVGHVRDDLDRKPAVAAERAAALPAPARPDDPSGHECGSARGGGRLDARFSPVRLGRAADTAAGTDRRTRKSAGRRRRRDMRLGSSRSRGEN